MNFVLTYLTLAIAFIVQASLGIYIDIYSVAPNLIFVFAVCYSMYNFPVRSAVLCLVAGILVDAYSCDYIGLNALLYMYIGISISNFASALIKKNIWTVVLGIIIVSALYNTIIILVNYVIPGYSGFFYPFFRMVLPGAVYDGAVSLLIGFWAEWLSQDKIRGL